MPYGKKNTKKYRKRRYTSRLADKKINTLTEKRIKEIAKKLDEKREKYTICRDIVTADGHWDQNISRPNNPMIINSGAVTYKAISQCARQYWAANPLAVDGTMIPLNGDLRPSYQKYRIGVKQVQSHLWIENFFPRTTQVRVALIFVPNFNSSTQNEADNLQPGVHQMGRNSPSGKFSGIFGNNAQLRNNKNAVNSGTDYTLIDSKTVTLGPRRYDNYFTNTTTGTIPNVVDNIAIPTKKKVTLNRTYKKPKKLYANSYDADGNADEAQPPLLFSNGTYFLLMAHDSFMETDQYNFLSIYGMSGLKLTEPEISGRIAAS